MGETRLEKVAADSHSAAGSIHVSAADHQAFQGDTSSHQADATHALVQQGSLPSLSLGSVSDSVSSVFDSAAAKVGSAISSGWDEAKDLGSKAVDFAVEHPGYAVATVVGAVLGGEVLAPAVGIGMIAGAVIGAAGLDAAVYGATTGVEAMLE